MNAPVMTRARVSALIIGAAFASLAAVGRAESNNTLRVAIQPIENAMERYYAKETGRFAAAGLDVDIQIVQSPSAIAAAVLSNAVDVGYSTIDVLASIHQKNIPLVVIAPASEYLSQSRRTGGLVLPANSTIHQAKDLQASRIRPESAVDQFLGRECRELAVFCR
jgi:ABC-type nitrate/sulfonate/bicarbonate transport system substrate-binding protein